MIRRRWIGYVPLLALLLAAAWGLRRDRDLIVAWRALRPSPVLAEPALRGASLGPATYQGRLQDPRLREASGIAASRLHDERFWLINDSGEARLFAVGPDGRHLGTVALDRSLRGDWEDLASFRWRGSAVDSGDPR